MSDSGLPQVQVSVALVTNQDKQILWTFNDDWGAFALPMSKWRRSREGNEPAPRAAVRAAAEALGVPVQLVEGHQKHLSERARSGRQFTDKVYDYHIFHVEPHPDFADRLQIRQPHLWLSPHLALSGVYEPLAEPCRVIVGRVIEDFEIPTRLQPTSVLLVRRQHPERGLQFLVRRAGEWGFALPAKRRNPAQSPLAAAERVAREELGLEPGTDVALTPARVPELKTHGTSRNTHEPAFGVPTDYEHALFDVELHHPKALRSDRPMLWVTPEEVYARWTTGAHPAGDTPPDRGGLISRTVFEILKALGEDGDFLSDEDRREAERWIKWSEMRRSEAAVALIRREHAGQALWLAQWNPKWRRYHFVSGHRHPDESFRECLVREMAEELQLREGDDYTVVSGPLIHLEYTAWSESAGAETRYTMEPFPVKLNDRSVQRVNANVQNRWLTEAEIRAQRTEDGKLVSETMGSLLSQVGWNSP